MNYTYKISIIIIYYTVQDKKNKPNPVYFLCDTMPLFQSFASSIFVYFPVWEFLSCSLSHSVGSIIYVGMMVGAFFWGGMADKVGRRQCLLICMSMNGFFAFLSSFVQGYGLFLLCRMIAGFGWVFCSPYWTFNMLSVSVNELLLKDTTTLKT